ncbi:hypothetical protein [Luteibacter sp. Lutesp34]|uniref:hypothetical protein n=1 Tax=Luteibacter sp. Lutesp34 TaxID=3243030 RepID=UPI0039B5C322
MSRPGYRRKHDLSLARQLIALRGCPCVLRTVRLHLHELYVEFDLRPLPESRTYLLALTLPRGGVPTVRVLAPDLAVLAGERELPHVYDHRHPVQLCLYLPGAGEWSHEAYLAKTIVPWAMEWLAHFEAWLFTSQWSGGGLHPGEPSVPRSRFHRNRRRTVASTNSPARA